MTLQDELQRCLDRRVESGDEVGVQVEVLRHGQVAVRACAGTTDRDGGADVVPGDLFFAASTAKGVLSSLAHVLVARGALDYDLPVATVWPQFAAHSKEGVTVRHLLLHQAGVPGLPADLTTEQLCDWDHMCAVIADAQPWWTPGTAMGYHAQTFGFLLGETLQRVTGTGLADLTRDMLTAPAGVPDELFFGVPDRLLPRVVRQHEPDSPPPEPPDGSPAAQALPPGARPSATFANRRDVLSAQIPSFATMTARGAAKVYAAMLGHGPGPALLPPDRLAAATAVAFEGHDAVMDMPTRMALGYSVDRPGHQESRPGSTFGMLGANGSAAYADIDTGVAVAVMRNLFNPDFATAAAVDDLVSTYFSQED